MSAFTNKTAAITGRNSGTDLGTARSARIDVNPELTEVKVSEGGLNEKFATVCRGG
jgi:hypothetical protein